MWPSTAAVLSVLVLGARASVQSISVPEVIKPGDTVDIKIVNNNSPGQYDLAMVFGFDSGSQLQRNYVGTDLGAISLTNVPSGSFNRTLTVNPLIAPGPGTLRAGIFTMSGGMKGLGVWVYDVNVTIGDITSTTCQN
ncbi:hypothetical protein Purlil1_12810 [Purpureocillium lilacinum]|uniref:Uncharacterized protein n=1 Tax=Purpureocillium lilacinum TaxID=33203 RepID=A0ABR0BG17_PURLI|nr:hypothetical protein Purlil1_12810 [Purpureocillium lilacinum]